MAGLRSSRAAGGCLSLCTLLLPYILQTLANDMIDYCHWEKLQAKCGSGEVILMQQAMYGRMAYGRCVERDYGYVGCKKDVLPLADARCSGRRQCEIRVPDEVFDTTKPCPKDLSRYLSAQYKCTKVQSANSRECRRNGYVSLRATSGMIGSVVTEETGCGTTDTPWVIEAQPGQRINITLYDFGIGNVNGTERKSPHCHVYVILKEREMGKSVTICGGTTRIKNIFLSESYKVEVRVLTGTQARQRSFLLHYEVIGCPSLRKPEGGWIKWHGKKAEMGCTDSQRSWQLSCNGTHWTGGAGNCSSAAAAQFVIGNMSLPYAMSLLIIMGVALLIGVCILVGGLMFLKRQRKRKQRPSDLNLNSQQKKVYKEDIYSKVGTGADPPSLLPQCESPQENEYAYVEDFFPPPPPPAVPFKERADSSTGPGPNHYEYTTSRCLPRDGIAVEGPCEECRESRHYFELDPDVTRSGTGVGKQHVYCSHGQNQPLLAQFGNNNTNMSLDPRMVDHTMPRL